MASGLYPTLTPFTSLPQITVDQLVETITLLINNGLNANQYVTLQILVAWINQNWSNVENLPPLQIADLSVTPPVNKYVTYNVLQAAFAALNINFTPTQNAELIAHLTNYDNPHEVTNAQIGLNFVENLGITTQADIGTNPPVETYVTFDILEAALDAFNLGVLQQLGLVANYPPFNPTASTNGQGDTYITYNDLETALFSTQTFNNGNVLTPQQIQQLQAHLVNYENPHQVTATQIGLSNIANLLPTYITDVQVVQAGGQPSDTYITYNILSQALAALPISLTAGQIQALLNHLVNYNNPHELTAAQIGLNNVANLLPISSSSIAAVEAGGTPPDEYVTYNMLLEANRSVGLHINSGLAIAVSVINPTTTSLQFQATTQNPYGYDTQYLEVSFTFYPTSNPNSPITTNPIPYSQSNNGVFTITEGPFANSTSYSVYATLNDTEYTNINIQSSVATGSTLSPANAPTVGTVPSPVNNTPPALASGTYFFNIVGGGSSDTTVFNSSTVNASNGSFNNYQFTVNTNGTSVVTNPIGDPTADGNFTSCSSQVSFIPYAYITPLGNTTATSILLSQSDYNLLSNGMTVGALVNGAVEDLVLGSNAQLVYTPSSTSTTPGSSYTVPAYTTSTTTTVPASTQEQQPSILIGSAPLVGSSSVYVGLIINYYFGASGSGNVVLSVSASSSGYDNSYSGASGSGNVLGSHKDATTSYNFYSGANGTGNIIGSVVANGTYINFYSGASGSGNVLGSHKDATTSYNFISNFYSGANGSGNIIGSTVYNSYYNSNEDTGIDFYSGAIGVNANFGLYCNQFAVPFPTTVTISAHNVTTYTNHPAVTVTNPSTTTTIPASWSINVNSGVLSGTPSLLWNDNNRGPEGCISITNYAATGSNIIGSNNTTNIIYLNGPQTFTNGQVVFATVNGSNVPLTIGTDATYQTVAAYTTSQTTPGSTYTIPASTQEQQPSIFISSVSSGNYYSGANNTGNIVLSESNYNYYSGANGSGNLLGSFAFGNYYSGANGSGNILISESNSNYESDINYYSGANSTGNLLGSVSNSNYYSGANGTGNVLGSFSDINVTIYGNYNYYSGANGTGNPGMYCNQFAVPFPTTVTIPAQTVTNPPVTTYTNHPAQYYLQLSNNLAAVPTGLYLTNIGYSYPLAGLSVTSETYDNGVITYTLATFTGNGRNIEVGFNNLLNGDTVVEFKGTVVQA